MRLIDTHCHLVSEKLKDSLPDILARAKLAGVEKIIDIAYDPETVELVCEQIKTSEMLFAACGIQPHDASKYTEIVAKKIQTLAHENKKIVAIGEIGLDYYYTLSTKDVQILCFEHFLQIAVEEDLPVVIHVRESHNDVYERLSKFAKKGLRGVIHCFTGSKAEAAQFLDLGFFISFSGIVTFKNATDLKMISQFVPIDRLLIETDSPYLAPIPHRGKTNEPAWVRNVCEHIAELRGCEASFLADKTFTNAESLFTRLRNN